MISFIVIYQREKNKIFYILSVFLLLLLLLFSQGFVRVWYRPSSSDWHWRQPTSLAVPHIIKYKRKEKEYEEEKGFFFFFSYTCGGGIQQQLGDVCTIGKGKERRACANKIYAHFWCGNYTRLYRYTASQPSQVKSKVKEDFESIEK